jgi:hypothetical protein
MTLNDEMIFHDEIVLEIQIGIEIDMIVIPIFLTATKSFGRVLNKFDGFGLDVVEFDCFLLQVVYNTLHLDSVLLCRSVNVVTVTVNVDGCNFYLDSHT